MVISALISVKIPTTLRLPITISLGHFISVLRPVTSLIALATARAVTSVIIDALYGGKSGFTAKDIHIPVFAGDSQCLSLRPLPSVCFSAIASIPGINSFSACLFISLFVESITSKYDIFLPNHFVSSRLCISSDNKTSGQETSR